MSTSTTEHPSPEQTAGQTPDTTETAVRIDPDAHAGEVMKALGRLDQAVTKQLDRADVPHRLRELVRIRASQLNGCAYCVDMHTKDARAVGETDERLTAVPVWRETPFFTARERAALAFAETLTRLSETHVPRAAYDELAEEFSPAEVGALIGLVVTINAWNGIGVSTRAWTPGTYER